ncbi:MAG: hypothetical protein LC804_17770 [Acidobacteria bacterium]|nr:hypothetical protein [Acidobacteriota bacterium]
MRRPFVAAFFLFLALGVAHTWPLATDPGTLSRNDNGDTLLIEWSLAWVAHQLPRDPLRLFDANIFYPAKHTLAFSEHLFTLAIMGAPLFWLGASPVLVYNLLLLAGFTLTGWVTSLVVHHWTNDWTAAIVAGSVMAFNAHTLTRLPHLHATHLEFLVLTLFALDRVLRHPTSGNALLLAAFFVLAALTSNYHMVFTLAAMAAAVVVRPSDWMGERFRRVMWALIVAGAVSAVCIFPLLLPYYHARVEYGLTRPLSEVSDYAASVNDYLSTASRLHYSTWSRGFYARASTALFPGVLPLALAIVAVVTGPVLRDLRARMCLAVGIVGLLLSFGTLVPGYSMLYRALPLLQGIRGTNRLGYLVIVATALLSAYGVAFLRTRWRGRRWLLAASIGAVIVVNLEAWRAPLHYRRFEGISPVYDRLAAERRAAIVEFPLYPSRMYFANAPYMLNSTKHWKPLINGYSAFIPPTYFHFLDVLATFPSQEALRALREAGVTHVVVHEDAFSPLVNGFDGLALLDSQNRISLYKITNIHP